MWRVDVFGIHGNFIFHFDEREDAETFILLGLRGKTDKHMGITTIEVEECPEPTDQSTIRGEHE